MGCPGDKHSADGQKRRGEGGEGEKVQQKERGEFDKKSVQFYLQ